MSGAIGNFVSSFLSRILGRLPIGWLQLSHSKGRFLAALSGVAFATVLVFVQLGVQGAMTQTSMVPYSLFEADIIISARDKNTLSDGSNVPQAVLLRALGVEGVANAAPLYLANIGWQRADGSSSSLQVFGLNPELDWFIPAAVRTLFDGLLLPNRVLLDSATRGLEKGELGNVSQESPYGLELNNNKVFAIETIEVGGGFSGDGSVYTSDQTFLTLFANRSSAAPNHVLIKVQQGFSTDDVVAKIKSFISSDLIYVATKADAMKAELEFMKTEMPTGVIFGFGVFMGIIVGLVIVYQVLSTDVANHLREYATFKAMGYQQGFFTSIVLEEAVVLATLGFLPGLLISVGIYSALSFATGLPVEMDGLRAVSVFAGTLVACALSGVLATRKLASNDPADLF